MSDNAPDPRSPKPSEEPSKGPGGVGTGTKNDPSKAPDAQPRKQTS